jgi:hypothetical protein
MVSAVRHGASQRSVARRFKVTLSTLQYWLARAGTQRLDRVDFSTHPSRPKVIPRKTLPAMEDMILQTRKSLRETSILGEYGAEAIHRTILQDAGQGIPSVRTINRVLARHGIFDGSRRVRRAAPVPGWYLPDVADGRDELDSMDLVEGLALKGGILIEVLNVTSLNGGLVHSWPHSESTPSTMVVECLVEHWKRFGLPRFAQFDNDTRFQGPHQHKDVISRVMRLCLSLHVVPVFAPPREHGFQNAIEGYNGRWQAKVWARFEFPSVMDVIIASNRYTDAVRQRRAVRIASAPSRRPFPEEWNLNLQEHPNGMLIYLRRTGDTGSVNLLGHSFLVEPTWCHRLVRCHVDLTKDKIIFYGLRRSQPTEQPLLKIQHYTLPKRKFDE